VPAARLRSAGGIVTPQASKALRQGRFFEAYPATPSGCHIAVWLTIRVCGILSGWQ